MKTLLLIALLSAPVAVAAEETEAPRNNLIGASVVGFAGFLRLNIGSYEVFYERRFGSHAVMATFDFIHVHQGGEHLGSHQWTFGGALTYRYFFDFAPGLFIGLKAGYRRGWGYSMEHTAEGIDRTDLINSQLSIVPQVGFRFAPLPWLRITTRFGLGYGPYTVTPKERTDAAALQAAAISRDTLATSALITDTELSIGFAF